ncbi:signal peptidase I [bacterium]|nr:signal peptidase I [bacterium]
MLPFLQVSPEHPYRVGDIVVFKLAGRDIPIVHRVLKVHQKDDGDVDLLTKGDNNKVDDRGLYNTGQKWLNKEHVIGRARGYLPYVGMVTIIMNDYPMFKCARAVAALLVPRELAILPRGFSCCSLLLIRTRNASFEDLSRAGCVAADGLMSFLGLMVLTVKE